MNVRHVLPLLQYFMDFRQDMKRWHQEIPTALSVKPRTVAGLMTAIDSDLDPLHRVGMRRVLGRLRRDGIVEKDPEWPDFWRLIHE